MLKDYDFLKNGRSCSCFCLKQEMLPQPRLHGDFEFFAYKLRPLFGFAPVVLGQVGIGVGPGEPSTPPPWEAGPRQRRTAEMLPTPAGG